MKRVVTSIALVSVLLASQSCATLLTSSSKSVTFKSNKDAVVLMNMKPLGKTNEPISIPRRSLDKLFTIELEGCETRHIELVETFNNACWIDVAWAWIPYLGAIPLMLDYSYGAQFNTAPSTDATLNCK